MRLMEVRQKKDPAAPKGSGGVMGTQELVLGR